MALFVKYSLALPLTTTNPTETSIIRAFPSPSSSSSYNTTTKAASFYSLSFPSSQHSKGFQLSFRSRRFQNFATPNLQGSEATSAADAFTQFKHLLLPITDRNPYLSEGTRQAAATTAALAKKYGAEITVLVIDENPKESLPEHDTQLSSIRWHLSEGGFQEFKLIEQLGNGSKPTAIIGEVAEDLISDLVVMSMESVHSKHVDANLLAEFIPCPVLLLPL
ncbi:UspA [Macleaya cordata]|uniref:UspA n=1 Tax=Macleaya cordata TaxID=56857 RepID=A0A200Q6P1_MACCD|nr:UspA [Macleaya cordata]